MESKTICCDLPGGLKYFFSSMPNMMTSDVSQFVAEDETNKE
jgi:hypothetical protein